MTIVEIEDTLPNGFHDAGLRSFAVDLANGSMTLSLNVDVGGTESGMPEFKRASLYLTGLRGFICDDCPFAGQIQRHLTISGSVPTEKEFPKLKQLSGETRNLIYSFFLLEWNSFIHVAATEATIVWGE